jgi:succinate dehydrogenase hydrophobic anchor subunit
MLNPDWKLYSISNILLVLFISITLYVLFFETFIGIGSWSMNRTVHGNFFFDFQTQVYLYQFLCMAVLGLLVVRIVRFVKMKNMPKIEFISLLSVYFTLFIFYVLK